MNEALKKAQEKRREMLAAGIVPERLNPKQRAERKPTSLRLAVTAMCWECMGGDSKRGVRQKVRDCRIARCALHAVRPWQGKSAEPEDGDTTEEE